MKREEVRWNDETQTLAGIVELEGKRKYVSIPREIIHSIHIYNDAVGWEIERFKFDIIERLSGILVHGQGRRTGASNINGMSIGRSELTRSPTCPRL